MDQPIAEAIGKALVVMRALQCVLEGKAEAEPLARLDVSALDEAWQVRYTLAEEWSVEDILSREG